MKVWIEFGGGIALGDHQDVPLLDGRHDGPGSIVNRKLVGIARSRLARSRESNVEDTTGRAERLTDVIDHDVLARLRIERQVLGFDEHAVAVDLEPALG